MRDPLDCYLDLVEQCFPRSIWEAAASFVLLLAFLGGLYGLSRLFGG